MRQYIMYGLLSATVLALLGYLVWLVLKALYSVYSDWRLGFELDTIQQESARRQRERAEKNRERLQNGCDHWFELGSGALPRRVCRQCGLEADRPGEGCDHVWEVLPDPIPRSSCRKCGMEVGGAIGIRRAIESKS